MTSVIGAPTLDDALAVLCDRAEQAERRGEKNLIFCEDRLTLLVERALLKRLGGTFLTEVTTFARFLTGSARVLSKQGSVMELSALIAEHRSELVCFGTGSAQAVYETVAQLSASRVTAEALRAGAEETEGALRGKLLDLAFLQEKYVAFLREKNVTDENGYLALLPDAIERGRLGEVNLYFFGFPSFTRQAREGVRAAVENGKSVTGIFVAGRASCYTNEGARCFRKILEEYGDARSYMAQDTLTGDALALRDGMFSPERFSLPPQNATGVRAFAAEDEESELRTVAALIRKAVFGGLRYRDTAVLVSDESVFPVAERVFRAHGIPFFADKKRALSEHPFCVFALDLLEAVSDGVLPAEADAIASNYYFGGGDEYRNYLLKFGGFRGAVKREIKEGEAVKRYDVPALRASREKMLRLIGVFPKKGKGRAFTDGVRELYRLVGGDETTERLAESFTGAEKQFLSLAPLEGILSEIDEVSGERTFTSREFATMLKSGAEACAVSVIPQSADAVFVGDCTESRFTRVRVLFATGLTDALPRTLADTAVISDREIGRLAELRVEIEPAVAQVNARARESLALNLCAFTDELYLSYPKRKGGEETARGEVLQYAEKLFRMPPVSEVFPYDCTEREPALLRLTALADDLESGRETDGEAFESLYAALVERGEGETVARLLKQGARKPISCGKELYFSGGSVSPTLLERYFSCPYAGFAISGLRLREREERSVLDTDTGTFVHAVLELTAKRLNEFDREEACRAYALERARELLSSPRFSALADTDEGIYAGERLAEESADVALVLFRQLHGSAFRVRETEGEARIPELALTGRADRVDESGDYVRVIDYKTGAIDDSPTSYYTGRKLQLELYLKSAAQGKRAAGAFYFPASISFRKPDEETFRMAGFFNGEDEVLLLHDTALAEGEKSAFFEGKRGSATDKGMSGEDFDAFLDYSVLVSAAAENEMKRGNLSPSPYEGACAYCRLKGLCGFDGEPRKSSGVRCSDVVNIVKRTRGEKV